MGSAARSSAEETFGIAVNHLLHDQTDFVRMLWKLPSVCNVKRQLADHDAPVRHEPAEPPPAGARELSVPPRAARRSAAG